MSGRLQDTRLSVTPGEQKRAEAAFDKPLPLCAICCGEFEPEEPGQTECDPLGCPGRGDGEPVQEVDRGSR